MRRLRETIGETVGRASAPVIAGISRARRARMFHPVGNTFEGQVVPFENGRFAPLARRLDGRVLARCSGALWRRPVDRLEVLGIALRFRHAERPFDAAAAPGDQDLLFATILSPWTMLLSPFTTNARDFLANTYYAVAPFEVARGLRIKLRLRPVRRPEAGTFAEDTRDDRLRDAVIHGRAVFALEARRTLTVTWLPVAHIVLEREIDVDQAALRFDPFLTGAGLVPAGLVHAMRRAAYPASQRARLRTRKEIPAPRVRAMHVSGS